MTTLRPSPDRRADLKARHRSAILDAADALIRERGKPQFSVDELAQRADVARRTVFNHFSSLDDVIMTTCTRVLSDAVDEFRAASATTVGDDSGATLFAQVTTAVKTMDLPTVVAYLWGVLSDEGDDGRSQTALQNVFTRTTEQLSIEIAASTSELDELEVAILVSSLMNGIAVICHHWIARTGAALDAQSREVWAQLLDRLITAVATGYSTTR